MALLTAVTSFLEVRRNLLEVRRLSRYTCDVRVLRGGIPATAVNAAVLDSSELVPGDVFFVDDGMRMPCDAVLLRGTAMVNEAQLTGESTVVRKVAAECVGVDSGSFGGDLSAVAAAVALSGGDAALPRSTLYAGTAVLQARGRAMALCVRTGFDTVKGRLVLSILFPRPLAFKFMEQALVFIGFLCALAVAGFAVNAKALADAGVGAGFIVQRGCDMVTIVVPPALPLALSVGTGFALVALRRLRIVCTVPSRISLAGKANAICFDKTGTLTTEGLTLLCVRPAAAAACGGVWAPGGEAVTARGLAPALRALLAACHTLDYVHGRLSGDPLELQTFALSGAELDAGADGAAAAARLPLDAAVATAAIGGCLPALDAALLQEASSSPDGAVRLPVERLFEFDAALARQGVVVRVGSSSVRAVLVKGAPEAVARLCEASSLPPDFAAVLHSYAARGLRVLGAAARVLDSDEAAVVMSGGAGAGGTGVAGALSPRADIETRLRFLGLLVLDNALKSESAPTIALLQREAGLPCTMITGDHAVTAVSVARACGIVPLDARVFIGDTVGNGTVGDDVVWTDAAGSGACLDPLTLLPATRSTNGGSKGAGDPSAAFVLALTGRGLRALLAREARGALRAVDVQAVLLRARVLARMAPEDKATAVEALQRSGQYVAMVGDGANDALALRAAHVGLALSAPGVDAAVSAPFTALRADIGALPALLAEGRGALATSFGLFQFMALYSTIQFATALLAVFQASFLSNNMYVFQDVFVVVVLALTMGATPTARALTRKRPSANLLSPHALATAVGFIALTFAWQAAAAVEVTRQPWYGSDAYPATQPAESDDEGTNSRIPVTTSLFLMGELQYAACAAVFSVGYPWKALPLRNMPFTAWLAAVIAVSTALFFAPGPLARVYDWLQLMPLPQAWLNRLFVASLLAGASYAVLAALLAGLKVVGVCSALLRRAPCRACRRPPSRHRALAVAWARKLRRWMAGASHAELAAGGWAGLPGDGSDIADAFGGGAGAGASASDSETADKAERRQLLPKV